MRLLSRDYWLTIFAPRGSRRTGLLRPKRQSLAAVVAKIALFAVVAWICAWWQAVIGEAQQAPPKKWALLSVAVVVGKDARAQLGWRDLGQKPGSTSAEDRHVAIETRGQELWLYNIAHTRKALLTLRRPVQAPADRPAVFETLSERLVIPAGATSELAVNGGKGKLTFRNVTDRSFDLEVESRTDNTRRMFRYHGRPNGLEAADAATEWGKGCAQPDRLERLVNAARLTALTLVEEGEARLPSIAGLTRRASEADIAVLGGEHDCVEQGRKQIGRVGGLAWRSLKVVRNGPVFMIAPYDASARARQLLSLSVSSAGKTVRSPSFQEAGWRIDDGGPFGRLSSVVLGKTTYDVRVERQGDQTKVTLSPTDNVTLFSADECVQPQDKKLCPSPLQEPELSLGQTTPSLRVCSSDNSRCWAWARQGNPLALSQAKIAEKRETVAWRLIAAGAALVIALVLAGWRRPGPLLLTSASVAMALAPNWLGHFGIVLEPLQALQLTLLNWLLATIILLRGPSAILLGLLWIAVTLMAALGSINLAMMVVDGDSSRWIGFFVKHRIMVLDFVPPLVISVASCPVSALRPALQVFVAGSSGWSRLVRFGPAALLALLFVGWFFIGRQTGFSVFQPVEAGKFAMIFLVATTLTIVDPRFRADSGSAAIASSISALTIIAVLAALLLGVPLLRSDWSPALIMALLSAGIIVAFGTVVMLRSLLDQLDAHYLRQQVPRAFKPAFSWRWWLKRTWFYALVLLFAWGSLLWFVLGSPISGTIARVTGVQTWKADIQGRLQDLEGEGLGSSRRVVVERIISWLDLDFGRPAMASCNFADAQSPEQTQPARQRACYVDIEWQLIRSRRVIADAPCQLASELRIGPAFSKSEDSGGLMRRIASVLGEGRACDVERTNAASGNASAPPRKLIRPIDIPVVESDFAGAYLIGRLGAAAGLMLYGAQALLLVIAAVGFVWLSWMRSNGPVDELVRRYVAITVAGAAWLMLLQWSLSWSNMLGLLPVMGQPMTWLSYATSHHLFMAVPCILVLIIGLRYAGMPPYCYSPRDPPRIAYNSWFS
ncbi:hypothetical protein [Bradyrhizobium aeschynomenes]|uniref:hypothetical protein n=1 Tax=Bradyrhizobium aeschynomenes TaxID=2734909 RepID=UPI001552C671|nr:hypothetical protein [Bradyrhizobium aeschynomenes]NPV19281.1 hypothetical protein [Bradyrhizobium aeschynomenes]